MFQRIGGSPTHIGLTQSLRLDKYRIPIKVADDRFSKTTKQDSLQHVAVWQFIFQHIIETSKKRLIEKILDDWSQR